MYPIFCNIGVYMRKDILESKTKILQWIANNESKAKISSYLNCKPETLDRYLKLMNINYKGNKSGKGLIKNRTKLTLQEYLNSSINIQTNKIRIKILEEGIKEYICEICGNSEWLGKPIPLEIHHKDGNKDNDVIENFMLLCPNCHAQTDSYRGRNCKKVVRRDFTPAT